MVPRTTGSDMPADGRRTGGTFVNLPALLLGMTSGAALIKHWGARESACWPLYVGRPVAQSSGP